MTSQYGDVYFRADSSRVCRSLGDRFTSNGLVLGMQDKILLDARLSDYVTESE